MIEIITEADYKDRLAATQNGVLLFFKKLCPHCKNMEKVLEKFGAAKPGIALYGIDIEENAAAAAALLSVRLQDLRLLRQRIGRAHPSAREHDSHRTGQKRKDQHGRADPAPDCFPSHGTTPRKKDTATIVAASAFAHNNMPRFPHHAGRASPSRSSDSRLDGRARLLRVPQ